MRKHLLISLLPLLVATVARADEECGDMEVRDVSMGMCMPLSMPGMPMKMAMLHYNSFFTETIEEKPRGRNDFTVPNMFMLDVGSSVGDRHYLSADLMTTFERWTFPASGTPELLQVGEANEDHVPYLDAQHPHSSPIMGLSLSDTYTLKDKDHVKVFFAPRGESTDGPVAFMHRPTGMVNPDAPLGHHIGQDVGHITSTVLGGALHIGETTLEASTFNGREPEPLKVDLPMGPLNSWAVRLTHEFTPTYFAMASAAYIKDPEPDDPALTHVWRYSASAYETYSAGNWKAQNAFIWGLVNFYDDTAALNSFAEEFSATQESNTIWGRIEVLQRTAAELQIALPEPNDPHWVSAFTLGYTHQLSTSDWGDVGLGTSVTKDVLSGEFRQAYGGDPLSAKIFLRVGGMKMWDL